MGDLTIEKTEIEVKEYETIILDGQRIELTPQNKKILSQIKELEEELENVKGTECEVYSRVVGYFRPVKQWNEGKQAEFYDREEFDLSKSKELQDGEEKEKRENT